MKMLVLGAALLTASAAALTLTSSAPPAASATIAFSKATYLPGEHAFLTINGTPGAVIVLGFDTDAGPTDLPGIGIVDLGLSNEFHFAVLPPLPASGTVTLEWHCEDPCAHAEEDIHVQGIVIDPVTFGLSVTNSDVLNVEDVYGFCGSTGCTPGYWKNHQELWGPTGLARTESFDDVFGVDAYDPDISLAAALNPTNPLGVFASHAVAALLNALHPDEAYALTADEVITMVQDALASGSEEEMLKVKDIFDHLNNAGCPF